MPEEEAVEEVVGVVVVVGVGDVWRRVTFIERRTRRWARRGGERGVVVVVLVFWLWVGDGVGFGFRGEGTGGGMWWASGGHFLFSGLRVSCVCLFVCWRGLLRWRM